MKGERSAERAGLRGSKREGASRPQCGGASQRLSPSLASPWGIGSPPTEPHRRGGPQFSVTANGLRLLGTFLPGVLGYLVKLPSLNLSRRGLRQVFYSNEECIGEEIKATLDSGRKGRPEHPPRAHDPELSLLCGLSYKTGEMLSVLSLQEALVSLGDMLFSHKNKGDNIRSAAC